MAGRIIRTTTRLWSNVLWKAGVFCAWIALPGSALAQTTAPVLQLPAPVTTTTVRELPRVQQAQPPAAYYPAPSSATDNDAYYQPYQPTASTPNAAPAHDPWMQPAPTAQQPQRTGQYPPQYMDNDTYYQPYNAPAPAANTGQDRRPANQQQVAPTNPRTGQQQTGQQQQQPAQQQYTDDDANYRYQADGHFYDPMYDY